MYKTSQSSLKINTMSGFSLDMNGKRYLLTLKEKKRLIFDFFLD